MAVVEWILYLFFLITLSAVNRGDAVACTLKESCILPCKFDKGDKILIHWMLSDESIVHSYYNDRDQLDSQLQGYRGRTSMFYNQIPQGNASLKLTGVTLQDGGKYNCYTSTVTGKNEIPVNLEVEAPPSKVNIWQEATKITCSADEIYPRPTLSWSSNPSSSLTADSAIKEIEQLFSINSSLTVSNGETDIDYTCTISAGTFKRNATLVKSTLITTSEATATIECPTLSTPPKSISWRFNNSETILTKTATDSSVNVTERWKKHVKDPSPPETLTLEGLSKDQEGNYTCEVSTEEETFVKNIMLTINPISGPSNVAAIVIGVVVGISVLVIGFFIAYKKNLLAKCKKSGGENEQQKEPEVQEATEMLTEKENRSAADERGPPMREYHDEMFLHNENCKKDPGQS